MILKEGSKGELVKKLQNMLRSAGFTVGPIDGEFGPKLKAAVMDYQVRHKLRVDGEVGQVTAGVLGMHLPTGDDPNEPEAPPPKPGSGVIERFHPAPKPAPHPSLKPYPDDVGTEWMGWLKEHDGVHEVKGKKDNPFIMELYKYGKYPIEHDEVPWCMVGGDAALVLTGYKGTWRADAKGAMGFGENLNLKLKYGAGCVIRHASGAYHFTFFDHWVDEKKKIAAFRGCNQSNSIRVSTYNISGNAHGHDQVVWAFWPELSA